jgi:hypothetical protein
VWHTKFVRNWAGCTDYNDAREKLHQLQFLKQIMGNPAVTDKGKRRKTRGVLNFMEELSKI